MATNLPEEVKQVIISSPIPSYPNIEIPDRLVWDGSQGVYTQQPVVIWLLNHVRPLPFTQDWKWLWKTCAPTKVQLLIWQILHLALPTNALRFARGLAASPGCQRCSVGNETILHVLRDCSHSREVWYKCGIRPAPSFFTQACVSEWIKEQVKRRHECLFLVGVWWLWCWRNNVVLGEDNGDAQQVTRNVVGSSYEYYQFLNPRRSVDASGQPSVRWKAPSMGQLKLNVDGSFNASSKVMCTGGLLRDARGD